MTSKRAMLLGLCLALQACEAPGTELDENGKPTLSPTGYEDPPDAKADGVSGRLGLSTATDREPTAVWEVRNQWWDTDTAAARREGMAWPANSGLTWDEKYRAWVDSMEHSGRTFKLTTPWGRELSGPALECAEVAIFLRVAFASWYGLPFFMEAYSGGERVFFGHFGIRTTGGSWRGMPAFRTRYADHSSNAQAIADGRIPWPSDTDLRSRHISGASDDAQPAVRGAPTGAYFDEIFLNKRVGYFLLMQLAYFGSINLADSANTFNLDPMSTRPGDVLVRRPKAEGIGHTVVVKEYRSPAADSLEFEVLYGNMPRVQPRWLSVGATTSYFTDEKAGGPGYVAFGGGIKRWRAATIVGGRWTNVVLREHAESFIPTTDVSRLEERPAVFGRVLTPVDLDEQVDILLEQLEAKREHLRSHPSSCAARTAREDVFENLYKVGLSLGMDRGQVDAAYRKVEDYVFGELVYGDSKTCCWNSTTPEMYKIIMDFNAERMKGQGCEATQVFMAAADGGDGYEQFRAYAQATGRGAEWVAWSADESCPQAGVPFDFQAGRPGGTACDVGQSWWDWLTSWFR